jgi:membrane protein involved in colicin uptake
MDPGRSSGSGAVSKTAAAGSDTSAACHSCAVVARGAIVVTPDGCALLQRNVQLEEEARRFYRHDGTFEELPTSAEVTLRRIAAAQRLEQLHGELTAATDRAEDATARVRELEVDLARERIAAARYASEARREREGRADAEARAALATKRADAAEAALAQAQAELQANRKAVR